MKLEETRKDETMNPKFVEMTTLRAPALPLPNTRRMVPYIHRVQNIDSKSMDFEKKRIELSKKTDMNSFFRAHQEKEDPNQIAQRKANQDLRKTLAGRLRHSVLHIKQASGLN